MDGTTRPTAGAGAVMCHSKKHRQKLQAEGRCPQCAVKRTKIDGFYCFDCRRDKTAAATRWYRAHRRVNTL
jgi:hypothetical protein